MIEPLGPGSRHPAPAPRRRPRLLGIVALLIGVAVLSGAVAAGVTIGLLRQSRVNSQGLNLGGLVPFSDESTIAAVAEKAVPSMVSIVSSERTANGSGFVVREDGYVVTNTQVVANAGSLVVVMAKDLKRHDARLVDYDCATGVAILKVDQISGLPTLSFAESGSLRLGQTLVAVGGPLEVPGMVSRGVVSALHQVAVVADAVDPSRDNRYPDAIETDARFGPSLSGGPLLSSGGQVVGVLVGGSSAGAPVAFGLASDDIQQEVDQVISSGQLIAPSLAVSGGDLAAAEAALRGLPAGYLVSQTRGGGPAALAGLRQGDVVTQLDDVKLDSGHPLGQVLRSRFKPGQRVTLTYSRTGSSGQVQLTLRGEHPTCG